MSRPAAARLPRAGLTRDGSGTTADVASAALGLRRAEEASAREHEAQQQHAVPTPHGRYQAFVDFGDAAGYRQDLSELRRSLRTEHCRPPVSVTPARGDRTGEGARHRPRRSRRQR